MDCGETRDGEEFSGVIRRDMPQMKSCSPPTRKLKTRIRRSDLKELRLGTMSIMPAGLDEQLSRQDLADLIAFSSRTPSGAST